MVHAILYCHVFCCGHSVSGRLRAALLVPWRFDAALCVISSDHVRGAWWQLVSSRRITPPRKFAVSKQIDQAVCLEYDPPRALHVHIRALTHALPRLTSAEATYPAARPSRRASGCVNLYTQMRRFSSQLNKLSPPTRTCAGSGISRPATQAKSPNSRRSLPPPVLRSRTSHSPRSHLYPRPHSAGRTANPSQKHLCLGTRHAMWAHAYDQTGSSHHTAPVHIQASEAPGADEPRQRRRLMASPVSRPIQFYPSVRKNPDVSENVRVS